MSHETRPDQHVKITFFIEQDDDGYPPVSIEGVRALPLPNGTFKIDNIPFFAKNISSGDVVSAEMLNGEWHFKELIERSGNSTIRIIFHESSQQPIVTQWLVNKKCGWEGSHMPHYIAVDVPSLAIYGEISSYLAQKEEEGILGYEESSLRH